MTKRQDAKARTRALILKTAKVAFEAMGYERADIRTIAAAAGMSTGAVFSNFASKAELYAEIFGHPPISPEAGRALAPAAKAALAILEAEFPAQAPDTPESRAMNDLRRALALAA